MAVLAAPPLLGATPNLVTILFLATALIGTTVIALFRTWVWLPPLAFLLAAPQVASSAVGGESVPVALATIVGFWLLNTIAAGGEEIRHPTDRLRPSSASLLLANAVFTLWAGTTVLDGAYLQWRGAFVAAVALANLALGLGLLARHGDRNPFGLIVAATGVAAVTMAVPIQFGAPWVPVAWAAEGVALYVGRKPPSIRCLRGARTRPDEPRQPARDPVPDRADGQRVRIERGRSSAPKGCRSPSSWARVVAAGVIVRRLGVRWRVVGILASAYVLPFETSGPGWWRLVGLTVAAMAARASSIGRAWTPTTSSEGSSRTAWRREHSRSSHSPMR